MQVIKKGKKTQTLGFYKENGLWYADLPQYLALGLGTKANLLMVDGSDTFLDLLSSNTSSVTVQLSTEPFKNHTIHLEKLKIGLNQDLLDLIGHAPVSYGAYYNVKKYHDQNLEHRLWLCPVAEYVFQGEYPQNIYLTKK
jgi:hypothetical protein